MAYKRDGKVYTGVVVNFESVRKRGKIRGTTGIEYGFFFSHAVHFDLDAEGVDVITEGKPSQIPRNGTKVVFRLGWNRILKRETGTISWWGFANEYEMAEEAISYSYAKPHQEM